MQFDVGRNVYPLYTAKHGFIKCHLYMICHLESLDYITELKDSRSITFLFYLDLRKTIEKVPYELLYMKQRSYVIEA